ncbi:hypothetical protein TWF694_003741 [Orbilia ellipsospora]|uniref:Uncharacterized protein n=1 Tax=Orbilia ellipsospora TaxID=2528407 RepID=A0AAV9WZ17_9PEZI
MHSVICLLSLLAGANALVVPAPRPNWVPVDNTNSARGLGTSADVYIYNEWTSALTVAGGQNAYMSTNAPPSVQVAANSVAPKFSVEANGWIPLQSAFQLTATPDGGDASTVHIDIGMTPFKTRYTVGTSNPAGQLGVMLAPAKILEKGRDFDFHIFSGPGTFAPFVQSLVDQKLPGLIAGLKTKPATFNVAQDIAVTLRNVVNPVVKANYVSLGSGKNGMLVNAIVTFDGEVDLTIALKDLKQDASIKVSGLSVLLSAEGNLLGLASAKPGQLNINLTRFQLSVNDININGDILVDVVGALYPVFAPLLKLPYKLASIANTDENDKILSMLNVAVKSIAAGGI